METMKKFNNNLAMEAITIITNIKTGSELHIEQIFEGTWVATQVTVRGANSQKILEKGESIRMIDRARAAGMPVREIERDISEGLSQGEQFWFFGPEG